MKKINKKIFKGIKCDKYPDGILLEILDKSFLYPNTEINKEYCKYRKEKGNDNE